MGEMKTRRHSKILEILNDNEVETQDELAEKLKEAGFKVTQATISRDIRELNLTKIAMSSGKQKYVVLQISASDSGEKLVRFFRDGVKTIDYAQNILVIKTLTGLAMGVAAAIDAMMGDRLMGTIAGDDTIFAVVKSEEQAIKIIENLKELL